MNVQRLILYAKGAIVQVEVVVALLALPMLTVQQDKLVWLLASVVLALPIHNAPTLIQDASVVIVDLVLLTHSVVLL